MVFSLNSDRAFCSGLSLFKEDLHGRSGDGHHEEIKNETTLASHGPRMMQTGYHPSSADAGKSKGIVNTMLTLLMAVCCGVCYINNPKKCKSR